MRQNLISLQVEIHKSTIMVEDYSIPLLEMNRSRRHKIILCDKTMLVLVTRLSPMLCDPMDCSPPCSSVHGIL